MSLYEILAVMVLVGAGGFAYSLYRSDMRRQVRDQPADSQAHAAEPAPDKLMFGRAPRKRGDR